MDEYAYHDPETQTEKTLHRTPLTKRQAENVAKLIIELEDVEEDQAVEKLQGLNEKVDKYIEIREDIVLDDLPMRIVAKMRKDVFMEGQLVLDFTSV